MNSRRSISRRQLLARASNGFGAVALGTLFGDSLLAQGGAPSLPPRHFRPRARSVIFLYMDGGVSQVDSFDPKPRLAKENGQPIGMLVPKTQFDDVGSVLKSPWEFRQHGESGHWISDLFPNLGRVADELCMVHSMTSPFPEHTSANYFLHTGHGIQGRPSIGAWLSYGLGSESQDLPGFVVLDGGLTPPGGLDNFASGFLPASHQASIFKSSGAPLANLQAPQGAQAAQRRKLDLLERLDGAGQGSWVHDDGVESAIRGYELAYRMQAAVPELVGLEGETPATLQRYGTDHANKHLASYGRQCLLARRLVERGVRFVELTMPHTGHDRWDQHSNLLKGHGDNAMAVDQPIAALIEDLRSRGLLDETLLVFAGEFGRTPMAQGKNGRDHNPHGFTIWMAGGGCAAGTSYGATDDYGYYAVENIVTLHDLQATMLHLLGMDHKRLTYLFGGRDMRLTDVHGRVIREWIA